MCSLLPNQPKVIPSNCCLCCRQTVHSYSSPIHFLQFSFSSQDMWLNRERRGKFVIDTIYVINSLRSVIKIYEACNKYYNYIVAINSTGAKKNPKVRAISLICISAFPFANAYKKSFIPFQFGDVVYIGRKAPASLRVFDCEPPKLNSWGVSLVDLILFMCS